MSLVTVDGLDVAFGDTTVVSDVSFRIERGETLALVGESGSGKSVTARSLVGLTGDGARLSARRLAFDDIDLLSVRPREWRELRGSRIGLILQDALVSLDPIRPVGREIDEALRVTTSLTRHERDARVIELLGRVGVPHPELRARQLPHELSGGLRQRALIASALAGDPDLLIADEPTTALDVTVQAQILELLGDIAEAGRSLLVISHDLAVVGRLAERVAVMSAGRIVETGPTAEVFDSPADDYTRALLAAIPAEHAKGQRLSPGGDAAPSIPRPAVGEVVARVTGLSRSFRGPDGAQHVAVDDVSFELRAGETLGIVGESGSGKTTTGRIVLGIVEPDAGEVSLLGRRWPDLGRRETRELRRQVQVISQDPLSSFDPRHTVDRILAEALGVARVPRAERRHRSIELLRLVGLGEAQLRRRPLQLSGGQRQRVAIARALATEPRIILLDEPVSALDVSVQAQVLDLLADLQARTRVAFLFISHDLGVVYHVSDRVLVMTEGRVVESGDVEQIFAAPEHPYTRELVAAVPRLGDARPTPAALERSTLS